MSIWSILKNIGAIISFFKTVSSLIGLVANKREMPPKEMLKDLLDQAEDLLDKGVIDIPGVDEAAISEALKQIEAKVFGA